MEFNPDKLYRKWYILIRTQDQHNYVYNSTLDFIREQPDSFLVRGSNFINGTEIITIGMGQCKENREISIRFLPEQNQNVNSLIKKTLNTETDFTLFLSFQFKIVKIWQCSRKGYKYLILEDEETNSVMVFSQWSDPSPKDYAEIMIYLNQNYDISRFIQIGHYHKCYKCKD